jgi:hypothetical protein
MVGMNRRQGLIVYIYNTTIDMIHALSLSYRCIVIVVIWCCSMCDDDVI